MRACCTVVTDLLIAHDVFVVSDVFLHSDVLSGFTILL